MAFDTTAITGNHRSKRYAISTEDGKVVKVAIEPDNTSLTSKSTESIPIWSSGFTLIHLHQSRLLRSSCKV